MFLVVFGNRISEVMMSVVKSDGILLICLLVFDLWQVDSIEILYIIDHVDSHNKIINKIGSHFKKVQNKL